MKSCLISLLLSSLLTAASDSGLPEGKGKEVLENTCTECHSLQRIKAQRLTEEGWNAIIREMIENGASVNGDDVKVIVSYLAKNFGPNRKVNVNQADATEMAAVLQLTSEEANALVQYRTRNGNYKNLSELQKASSAAAKIAAKKAMPAIAM